MFKLQSTYFQIEGPQKADGWYEVSSRDTPSKPFELMFAAPLSDLREFGGLIQQLTTQIDESTEK